MVLIIPAFYFFLKPGIYWNMHDDMQIIRQLEFEKCIKDGQIPCRWVPDLAYGYGYPLFNFYPPLPYIFGMFFRILNFSFVDTIKLVAIVQIILTAYFMYILGKSLTNRWGGLLSSIFYTYAPYHAVNIYIRGAMNEAWASTFFPLVFYFIRQLVLEPKLLNILGLSLSFCGILLSHEPMVLIFTPLCFAWLLFWLVKSDHLKSWLCYKYLILSGLLSLFLSAFLILPLVFEKNLVQVDTMFSGYYYFSGHFATVYQLFLSRFWGDGPSVWGTVDKMSFMIGYFHWIVPLFILIFSTVKYYKSRKLRSFLLPALLVLSGFAYAFMAHERSTPIWLLIRPIQNVQFPWRFLNVVIFSMSLSVAFFPKIIKNRLIIILLILSVIVLNYSYFYPVHSGPITDKQKFSGESWHQLTSGSIYDYLPKSSKIAPTKPANDYVDEILPSDTVFTITGQKKGTDWMFFNLILDQPAIVALSQISFPNFVLNVDGQNQDYQIDSKTGRIQFNLNSGDHQIYLKLKNTPIRSVSNSISLFSWLLVISLLSKSLWKKLT